ncbi:MAG TPA: DHHA1 domain-containing protein [Candidatus Omnitrophota bacterium]|nr:DHHA1 domain-containing protein [Candidatus Omnitrophota bacterium]
MNRHVQANIRVEKNEMTMTEAREKGALAFFAEKYGQTVRVIHVPGCSTELCGGTHLDNTGEIKLFKIISESAIAQGIRRIEATTASLAEAFIKLREQQTKEDAEKQKTKEKSKELQQQAFEALKTDLDSIIDRSKDAKNVRVITHTFEAVDINMLRNLSDIAKQKAKSCAVVFASKAEDRGSLIIALTDDLVKAGISAQDIVKTIAPVMHGSGGGRAQFAQAGSKETAYLPQALREAERLLTEQLIQAPLP